jgi:phosphoribosylamine--glycine ligase
MCVVAASGGYPGKYEKGYEISGLPENNSELKVIHAGTKLDQGILYTNGGRVLNIVAISSNSDLSYCKTIAYSALDRISFKNIYYRKDIGFKALKS